MEQFHDLYAEVTREFRALQKYVRGLFVDPFPPTLLST